ncbi:hypothetical protein P7D22_16770 [Lichenihabitans sp. Uapishka_5]|uniref:hypothetical protein n=1 Tax=Lichenihabitans sp. Uapishka_5 TaxID=3037302 RepID=UPI0029E816FB|nr:hypothetical protein [Lichenihabitans sp. Uapishka_5]MDX7952823.1 hypothetical protein [Lichenihabitans sp. Uapishka_5]
MHSFRKLTGAIDPLALVVMAATFLVLAPLYPTFPALGLDAAWAYGMSYATGAGLRLGHDLLWTYGPLGTLFDGAYNPLNYGRTLLFAGLLSAALTIGFARIAHPRAGVLLLLLPVIVARELMFDALAASLAVVFLLVVTSKDRDRSWAAVLAGLAFTLGMLADIKGSYVIPAAVGGGLGCFHLLLLRHLRIVLLVMGCALLGLVMPWLVMGQGLSDLPSYLGVQFVFMSGFSAMAQPGPGAPIGVYWLAVVILAGFAVAGAPRGRWTVTAGLLLTAFFVFKAGFVRQDGHTFFAAAFLLFSGLALCFASRGWVGVVPLLAGFIGCHAIDGSGPLAMLRRAAIVTAQNLDGMHLGPSFPQIYADAQQAIRQAKPLPATTGTVDLYNLDTAVVLASNKPWNPRPVFQSYQAYTPFLAGVNRDHLLGPKAPDTIFFDPATIDARYPAFDDALSWPVIVARYRFRAMANALAVLDKRPEALPERHDAPIGQTVARLGDDIPVPAGRVWASIDTAQTWRGRALSVLFRSAGLDLEVSYGDGHKRVFRLVAPIARGGFLLSPTIDDASSFVALLQGHESDPASRAVKAIRVLAYGSGKRDWQNSVTVRFFRFSPTSEPAGAL